MPRKPAGLRRKRELAGLSEDQRLHLIDGWCLDGAEPDFSRIHGKINYPFRDDNHRNRLWQKNQTALMARCPPGFRPKAFWDYSAPEQPRSIGYTHFHYEKDKGHAAYPCPEDTPGALPEYETEFECLKRLGLLLPGEEEANRKAEERKRKILFFPVRKNKEDDEDGVYD